LLDFSLNEGLRLTRTTLSFTVCGHRTHVAAITWLAFALRAKSLIARFLYILPILPIALEWGFAESTAASVMASGSLGFFFTQPLFSLNMSDPQDWVALGWF
jgi:K+-sensing histidine kinase KdpD